MNKPRRRIVIVINDFLVGGAQRLILSQLAYADHLEFEYHVITLFEFSHRKDLYALIPSHIPVHRIGMHGGYDGAGWLRLYQTIKKVGPEVVFSHLFFANAAMRLYRLMFQYKIYTVEHNTYTNKKIWQVWIDRILAPLTTKIIAVSSAVRAFTIRQQWLLGSECVVIQNGIDLKPIEAYSASTSKTQARVELNLPLEATVFLSVGRLTTQKNHALLLDALAKAGHDAVAIFAGEGELLKELEAQAVHLKISHMVRFVGSVENIYTYYRAADFLISVSLIEGMSMAYLEAMAFGLPIIATKTGGTEEIIAPGENGILIQNYTTQAVCDALADAQGMSYSELSAHALEKSKNFSIEKTIRAYEELARA
jgi:glycosyltransferase involved in cell wall biosynthesis